MTHTAIAPRPLRILPTLPALLAASLPVAAQVVLDQPQAGWRQAPAQQQDFVQEVHYPAAAVNANKRSASALISGRIQRTPKAVATAASSAEAGARQPARLIVDGIALPLLTAADGSFARPWSFGGGSHSVEVRSPAGSGAGAQHQRRQFYEAQTGRTPVRLRVVLSWDSDSTDLDLHVVSPDGEHVYYGHRVAGNGAALDVDVTTGYGPEIYASPAPPGGIHHVYVNYYGAGRERGQLTTAQVAVVQDEGTPREKQQVFRVPLRKPGELTHVHSFRMP
ncbi:MAG: hypothetical protein RLZZ584_4521 [Pseudomonadota bacterium]|jgi:uncharacterized protein YfaP (DUF2135 family)